MKEHPMKKISESIWYQSRLSALFVEEKIQQKALQIELDLG
jgi:hypothetical protein